MLRIKSRNINLVYIEKVDANKVKAIINFNNFIIEKVEFVIF